MHGARQFTKPRVSIGIDRDSCPSLRNDESRAGYSVTAEAAGSSPVVPAIPFSSLARTAQKACSAMVAVWHQELNDAGKLLAWYVREPITYFMTGRIKYLITVIFSQYSTQARQKRAVAIEKEYWAPWVLLNHTAACREARIELGIDDATRNCIGQRCTASMP